MHHSNQSGQSLIEVIVAAAVGILVVTALTFATIFSLRNANFAKNSALATKLAQEGIEWVRTGRDRNQCISNLGASVNSWNGSSSNSGCPGPGSVWNYQISVAEGCDNPSTGGKCYFSINPNTGALTRIGFAFTSFPTSGVEKIPITNTIFQRVVILSDDSAGSPPRWTFEKIATAVVQWTDATGTHESRLTTVLRKL